MSVTLSVYGVVPADAEFRRMLEIYKLCEESKVAVPEKVVDFFGGETPDPDGLVIWLDDTCRTAAVAEWADGWSSGYEIEIAKLDPKIKKIRCTVS